MTSSPLVLRTVLVSLRDVPIVFSFSPRKALVSHATVTVFLVRPRGKYIVTAALDPINSISISDPPWFVRASMKQIASYMATSNFVFT